MAIPVVSFADGPFGLSMGMTYDEIKAIDPNIKSKENFIYKIKTVPRPYPGIDMYILYISPTLGLSRIITYGADIKTSIFGTKIISKFNIMAENLSSVYGTKKQYNFLKNGSRWDDPQYWTMGLLKRERTLATVFGEKSLLKNNITSIFLQAVMSNRETGYLTIWYEFSNHNALLEELKDRNSQSL